VLGGLPSELQAPILVAQHMPPTFTAMLAEHLGKDSGRPSHHAADGLAVERGEIYVAPGDYHMTIRAGPEGHVIRLDQSPPENFCRPAVDPLLRSVAAVYGPAALAVVLTGMGEDGRRGSEAVVRAGGTVIAQDEATSVVWGMPGAVAREAAAAAVLPLKEIASEIARLGKAG
jgi:two-component system chemotaxis response regulator CheB